eukprot:gnl/MRDRNA2_/MRDRNA2_93115_c0_seq1.p1 gnl/MRDRNA2_/MRDRNA2_93115_c0~~gnl/MRDRNA2_/MRDRNA2_93115_c0_seq1.p1  ORF type:complete len:400 (-),score=85.03 gnl/MRDRNA2_/MRDRNA2_93115_c0_seq1:8-1207(-)
MKCSNMKFTYVLLFCSLFFHGESSQAVTSYEPRSTTLEGIKQQRLEKTIDDKIKKIKAAVGTHHTSGGLHGHTNRSNKSSNPFVHHMQELLNGTAMANVTLHNNVYHIDERQGKVIAHAQRTLFKTEHKVHNKQNQVGHVEETKHLTNQSTPVSQVTHTKDGKTLSSSIHNLVADMNATAKELKINISRPAVTMKTSNEPKSLTSDEIKKANTKIFGESPHAWKRESQTQHMQTTDSDIKKQMDQIKKKPNNSSRQRSTRDTVADDIQRMVAHANATAKELNINISNLTSELKMPPEPQSLTHAQIEKANKKIFQESSNAWRRESQTKRKDELERDIQKQVEQPKNHSTLSRQKANNHSVAKAVEQMATDVQELNTSMISKKNLTNRTNQTNFLAINLR